MRCCSSAEPVGSAEYAVIMRSRDTTAEAYQVQLDARRAMSGSERLRAVLDLCDDLHRVALDGIRSRHPEASEQELVALLIDQWHGAELGAEVRRAQLSG